MTAQAPTTQPVLSSRQPFAAMRAALRESATPVGSFPKPEPDRLFIVRSTARSTEIVGLMLDGISEQYGVSRKPAALVVRIGRIMWAVVEAAVPRSVPNLLIRYWFSVLLLVEILMIVGGTFVSGEQAVQALGVKLAVFTLAARVLIEIVRYYLEGRRVIRMFSVLFIVIAAVFVWLGTIRVREVIVPRTRSWFCNHTGGRDCDPQKTVSKTN